MSTEGLKCMKIKLVFPLLFFIFGCGGSDWDYLIKLGDSREKVVSMMGSGNLTVRSLKPSTKIVILYPWVE